MPLANSWQEIAIVLVLAGVLLLFIKVSGIRLRTSIPAAWYGQLFGAKYPRVAVVLFAIVLPLMLVGAFFVLKNDVDRCASKGGELQWWNLMSGSTRCVFPDGSWD